jgi:hypothetical protein
MLFPDWAGQAESFPIPSQKEFFQSIIRRLSLEDKVDQEKEI